MAEGGWGELTEVLGWWPLPFTLHGGEGLAPFFRGVGDGDLSKAVAAQGIDTNPVASDRPEVER